jgi:hypothetical protein
LTPGTVYNFNATSIDASGNTISSGNYSFTTLVGPPVISNVQSTGTSSSGTTITWTTTTPSTSQVAYVSSVAYLTPQDSTFTTSHSVTLVALKAGTTYTYYVQSTDANGSTVASAKYTFTTGAASSIGPVVSSVTVLSITASGAQIIWQTDRMASTRVAYGTTSSLGQFSNLDNTLSPNHWVGLSGLNSGTNYYFAVISADANGNSTTSPVQAFGTISLSGPSVLSATPVTSSNNTAVINVSTDRAAITQIVYGTTTSYGFWSAPNVTPATTQTIPLTWVPSGTIHFQVRSTDTKGNLTVSGDYTFVEP